MQSRARLAWIPITLMISVTVAACGDSTGPTGEDNPMVVDNSGGTISADAGRVQLEIPAGALGSEVEITVERAAAPAPNPRLVTGTAYEFGPDGLTFERPVDLTLGYDDSALPAGASEERLRIFEQVGSEWRLDSEEARVDTGANRVNAPITGFSTHAILYDECATVPVEVPASITGSIDAGDCGSDGRFHELFEFEVEDGPASAGRFSLAGGAGLQPFMRLTTPGRDLSSVISLATARSDEPGGSVSFAALGAPDEYQLFVSGQEGTTGDYTLTVDELSPVQSLGCSEAMFIVSPVAGVPQTLDDAVDCLITIQFPSNPSVDGKETIEEYYYLPVPAGRTVVVTTTRTGGEPGFAPFPTFFLGGGEVVQAPDGQADSRTIRYTATQERWITLGVSATLVDDGGTLRYAEGSYSLTAHLE